MTQVFNIIAINKIGKINRTFQKSYNYKNIIIKYKIQIDVELKESKLRNITYVHIKVILYLPNKICVMYLL